MHKKIAVTVAVIALAVFGMSTAFAMLMNSSEIKTEFEVGYCDISIERTGGLRILNKSNLPCYIRVAIDVSDSEKSQLCHFKDMPGDGWTSMYAEGSSEMSGYYYYTSPVEKETYTSALYTSVSYDDSSVSESDIQIYAEAIICADYDDYVTAWSSLTDQ